jgi:hypothetical protein
MHKLSIVMQRSGSRRGKMLQDSGNALQDVQVAKGCVIFLHFGMHTHSWARFRSTHKVYSANPNQGFA